MDVIISLRVVLTLLALIMKIKLEDIVSLTQICFFTIGATVALLTYKSAKKGLLNTVNTEYQKRVMDRLEILSNTLYSEFDPDSEEYWGNRKGKITVVDIVFEDIENYKVFKKKGMKLNPGEKVGGGAKEITILTRLNKLVNNIKSDPFLPEEITDYVVDKLNTRQENIYRITYDVIIEYRELLYRDRYLNLDTLPYAVANDVNSKLYQEGCGISQVEEEVHNIRILIRNHLKSFDPIGKK